MNLTTGSYTTGVPPAGTAACGDSRSITVSGVFCDVADDGTVHGLVLVEYHYADDGSIDSVRLVDAATGTTYTLQGQLTVCPSGGDDDESPGEAPAVRQVVERCGCDDSDGDGIGDIRYVELWSVDTTGGSPAFLIGTYIDGDFDQPYIPANPVDCQDAGGDESPGEPTQTCAPQIVERCGCDDSDGDGIGDVRYTELWAIDPCGGDAPALLGAWVDGDFDQPYTPVAPVDCIGGDESPGELAAGFEVAPVPLCVIDDASGNVLQNVLAEVVYDQTTGDRTGVRYVDHVTGAPVALPGGTHLGVCPQTGACSNCETLLLCDVDPTSPSTIAGTAASGTLSNGVGWTATGPAPFAPSRQSDGAAWWGLGLFPNTTVPVTTWTFNQPVTAEFSVAMSHLAGAAAGGNTVQLPAGAQPLSLPPGYTFDRATGVLSADATVTGCPQIRTPSRETSARFRLTGVTSFALQYLGVRALVPECQVFGNWAFGAVDVSLGGQFLRTTCRDCQGEVLDVTDTTLDGTSPYTPTGTVGLCHPPEAEPCASTVQILRLCDLNPAVEPGDDGKRCAVPFLRHLIHSCDGALAETRDTEMDGTTAYTPVKVVDCGSGGVPALSELLWPQTGIAEDPAGVARQDFVYTVTNPETGEVAQVKLHASSASPGGCGAYDPANPVFNNPTVYTLTLDAAAQEMSTFRLDLLDFDTFEGVTGLSPLPSRVEGDVTWNGSTITANQSNSTAYVYFDSPPAQIAYRYGNTGGGLACTSVRFQGMTLVPDGCCGCGTGDEPCRNASTLLLCDLPQDGEPALTVTDTDPTPYYSDPVAAPVTGAQALWAGGTLDLPPGTAPQPGTLGTVNTLAAKLTAARPACDDGTATVTVSVLVAQTGPDDACGAAGHLRLFNGTQQVALEVVPNNAPVGWSATLTATATVPAADVAAGNVAVVMALDAYDSGSCTPDPRTTGWNLSQFTASTVYDQDTCAHQILANVVADCETGQVIGISYTALDGQAYEPTGEVGQCQPTGGGSEQPCGDTELLALCDTAADGTVTEFLRGLTYDCSGALSGVSDTGLDGVTPYTVIGTVGQCQPVSCDVTPVCLRPSGQIEFISNPTGVTTGTDADWTWGQSLTGPWFPMYEVGIFPGWNTADPGTSVGTAHWVAPHPDAGVANTGEPGEGPTISAAVPDWYARASFALPSFADPATIRIAATVLNADQLAVEWRLNAGAWQPVNKSHVDPPYTFPATAVPGAQAGVNEVLLHVNESVFGSGGAGVIMHLVVTYDVDATAYIQWTHIACSDGTAYYVDDAGQRQDALPDGAARVPCPGGSGVSVDTEVLALCDVDTDGTSVAFLRFLTIAEDGTVTVADTELDGVTAYTTVGTVVVCDQSDGAGDESPGAEPCRDVSTSLLCDVASQSTITVFDPLNVPGADGWQVTSFTGFNADAPPQAAMPYDAAHPAGYPAYMGARDDLSSGTATVLWTDYDAAPVRWVLTKQFTAPEDGMAVVEATGFRGDGGARVRINGQDVGLYGQWNQPAVGGSSQVPVTAGPNVIEIEVRDTGGPNTVQGRLDVTMTQTNQFFRKQVTDCETGAVVSTVDTTLDGQPYTVTGTVGQCEQVQTCCPPPAPEARVDLETQLLCILDADGQSTGQVIAEFVYDDQSGDLIETRYKDPTSGALVTLDPAAVLGACPAKPCGDTEGVQLCDLTYDPQAPIPTPAGDFTLTGNVVAANGGTTLWFAQANQVANGVAELTVGGLLPAVMYEFRFASAWIGAGAPDPANNNAIYLLEVLDGTTVLATRTRNTSNGSNVFPGGVLSEDLPPLAFIAPATGAVTIRFTDQTTGGAINDRDLFLMPIEVRTAVLTVTSTPFLRRFTFDCDGGLTSTQDFGLDGATPYVVQGEVGSCASSGDGSSVTAPTGDVVDCEDGSRALLVKVCDASEEAPCRDSTTMLVCDIPASTTTEVDADLTDSTGAAAGAPAGWGGPDLTGPYTALWSGGTLTIPATAGPTAQTTAVAGVLTADVPGGCDAATGTLTVSVKVTNDGPAAGQVWDGTLQLKKSGVILADAPFPLSAAVGQTFVRTVSVPVTLADLASGELYVLMGFETYHLGAKGWTAEEFSAVVELEGCEATTATQILRTVVTDCETGEVVSTSDTTLDGTPYTVTGEVGQCIPADTPAACCPTGETLALCDVADDGTTTAFLRRLTYTQDSVTPAVFDTGLDGATPYTVAGTVGVCSADTSDESPGDPCGDTELVELCDLVYSPEPPFPTPMSAFARTGNVKVVGAGLYYSGGNAAPNGVATLPVTGLTGDTGYAFRFLTSWAGSGVPNPAASDAIYLVEILDGTTVLASQQRNISNGTGAATGYVDETPLSFTAPASGAVTLRISDVSTGNGADRDLIVIPTDVRSGALAVGSTAFLRAITFGCDGSATSTHDLALDGVTPYTVAGEVATCAAGGDGATTTAPGPDTEAVVLCDLPADPDADPVPFLRLLTVTADGTVTAADTALDGVTPYTVAGTVGVCPGAPDGPIKVVEQCRCDQTPGGVVEYVELIAVAEDGTLTTIGTYDEDFAPYTPVSPVDCPVEGAPPAMGVQARRVELAPGGSWSAAGVTLLQSVTAVSHAGSGTVTTMDGDSTLHDGESVTWSVARDTDAALTGPLTITAGTGTVTIAFTTAVTL
ncbi:hypothetical protein ACIA8E_07530 [Streptomyces sp. NPDC051664]|uniref:hypothetical protein n=1 Tax=Streptomyces sp. NPDC051664 TaxID=3365668 RepID=UPI0037ADBD2D